MPPRRLRLTRAGRVAVVVAVVLVIGGLAVAVTRLLAPPDCVVRSGGRTVELDQHEAERAATAVASVVRRGGSAATARSAVARAVSSSTADSGVIADALTGRTRAALSCRHGGSSRSEPDRLDARGLTRRAEAVRQDLVAAFGPLPLGGYAPGGVR